MPNRLEKHLLGLRIHDVNQGLVAVSSGFINKELRKTKRVGVAAQIAGLIAGEQVVGYDSLLMAAGELQIDDTLLDRSLSDLSDLDWIRVIKQGAVTRRVEVKLPRLRERYGDLGDYWDSLHPSETEQKAILTVDELALMPRLAVDLKNKFSFSPDELAIFRDVGKSAGILDSYTSPASGREIYYSPLYWEEHPAKLFQLQETFKEEEIADAIRKVRGHQGLSCDDISDGILGVAITSGFLPTVSVDSTGGEKQFVFTPIEGLAKDKKLIFQKAMAILACVRYGQRYATITKLVYSPEVALSALLRKKQIGAHSEIRQQYSPLVKLRIGRISGTSRYTFHLIETPDNLDALQLAIRLATLGQGEAGTERTREATKLLLPQGQFKTAIKTRIDYRRSPKYSARSLDTIHAIIGGVSSDVV